MSSILRAHHYCPFVPYLIANPIDDNHWRKAEICDKIGIFDQSSSSERTGPAQHVEAVNARWIVQQAVESSFTFYKEIVWDIELGQSFPICG